MVEVETFVLFRWDGVNQVVLKDGGEVSVFPGISGLLRRPRLTWNSEDDLVSPAAPLTCTAGLERGGCFSRG